MAEIVLIGSGITVLGTARCLAHAGMKCVVLSEFADIERYSRWYRPFPGGTAGAPKLLSAVTADAIRSALESAGLSDAVLIPCSDHAAAAAAELTAAGFPCKAVVSAPALLNQLVDKARFAALLERHSIPRPAAYVLDGAAAVPELPRDRGWFLKPRDSQAFFRVFGVKGIKLRPGEEPAPRIAEIRARGLEAIIQEYIGGGAKNHVYIEGYIAADGAVKALFARRRERMYPPDYGNSTAMVSIPLSEVGQAAADLTRLLAETAYRGIFSAEFKLDPRDGIYKVIEINARAWWYVHFAEMCGVNIPALNAQDAQGCPTAAIERYAAGRRAVYGYYDLYALAQERGGKVRAALALPSEWLGATFLVFALDDPRPAVMTCLRQIAAGIKKRLQWKEQPL